MKMSNRHPEFELETQSETKQISLESVTHPHFTYSLKPVTGAFYVHL